MVNNPIAVDSMFADMTDAAKRLQDAGVRFKSARTEAEKPAGPWFAFKNLADGDTTAQIDIYDEIDWFWGVSAVDFRNQLKALPESVTQIDLHVNSPGGDVYEAIAIMNCLRQHDAKVVTTVDGLAASSAGFIAVGASDELIVAENAEIMAHLPWAIMIGDSADMRKMADDLDRIGKNIASIFVARAGGSLEDWMSILTAETWWSADEAVTAGIADSVLKTPKRDAKESAKNRFNLAVFNHAGRSAAPAPQSVAHNQTPQAVEVEASKKKENTVATLSESALQKLGLDAEADESAIDAAIGDLAEKAAVAPESVGDGAAAEPTIEQAAAVAAKFGQKLVNTAHYDQMTATVADLSARRDAQIKADNEVVIMNAIKSGRITPASADTWRGEIAKNREGTTALIATLPENNALPVDMLGHAVDSEGSAVDAEMAGVFARVTGTTLGKDA